MDLVNYMEHMKKVCYGTKGHKQELEIEWKGKYIQIIPLTPAFKTCPRCHTTFSLEKRVLESAECPFCHLRS